MEDLTNFKLSGDEKGVDEVAGPDHSSGSGPDSPDVDYGQDPSE